MVDVVHHRLTNSHPHRAPAMTRLAAILKVWRRRVRERGQLARLDERELHDIGLSRAAIHDEINKPFWRA